MNDLIRVDAVSPFPRDFRTATVRNKRFDCYYRDVNNQWAINTSPLTEDEEAIKRQVVNLLATPRGSEHFEPNYGSNIPFRLMENINEMTAYLLETDTFLALWTWMRDRIFVDFARSRIYPLETEDGYFIDGRYVMLASSKLVVHQFDITR